MSIPSSDRSTRPHRRRESLSDRLKGKIEKMRRAWRKVFFWQQTPEGSEEFKPKMGHDHALVLSVTSTKPVPRWQQWRFLTRVLSPAERRLLWIAISVFVISLLIGFGDFARPHLVTVPTNGGTITEALIGTPKLINPLFAPLNDVDRDLSGLIYSGLFRIDETLEPQPDLADHYRWLDDGKTLEVVLRKDARFHDGQPVTSQDIVFTFQAAQNPNWRSPLAGAIKGMKIVAVDDQTVQFQTDKPHPNLLVDLALGILPQHLWENVSDANAHLADTNIKPIGSGPYRVESFTRDAKGIIVSYQLKRFSSYYGIKPQIENWQFRFFADRDQARTAIENNQVDALALVPWADADTLKGSSYQAATLELPQESIVFFNVLDQTMKDEKLRKALALAIDRDELQSLIGKHATVVTSPFPFLDATTSTPVNLEAARAQLDKLGWTLKPGEAVRSFTPSPSRSSSTSTPAIPLTLTIDAPDQPDLLRVAEWLKRRWSLLGARVEIQSGNAEALLRQAMSDRDYQILIWNVLLPPNQDISLFWSSTNANEHGLNLSNLADRDVDNALGTIQSATSSEGLLQARLALSTAIIARNPALFLIRPSYAYLVSTRIKGVTDQRISRPADRLTNSANWYISTTWRWR